MFSRGEVIARAGCEARAREPGPADEGRAERQRGEAGPFEGGGRRRRAQDAGPAPSSPCPGGILIHSHGTHGEYPPLCFSGHRCSFSPEQIACLLGENNAEDYSSPGPHRLSEAQQT